MRVRFAPSPTGALHIGSARTALYNWLLARHAGGTLVLRIEDTDPERSTEENVEQILDALRWLQLDYDEGPISQVSRTERHQEILEQLLEGGHAYRSSATAEDVRAYKARHGAERGFRGEPEATGAVRLRVPDDGATVVHDAIRGDTTFVHSGLRDAVEISREKVQTLADFWPLAGFIFDGPADDPQARERWLGDEGRDAPRDVRAALEPVDPFALEPVQAALEGIVRARGGKPRQVVQPVRLALAGTAVSPGIFETLVVLGRDEALARIDRALPA